MKSAADDGLGDTIKPRLEHANADCSRVIVIDETDKALSLLDERIERAIAQGKNNLAPEGRTIGFELDPDNGFRWTGVLEMSIDDILSGSMPDCDTTYDRAIVFLKAELAVRRKPAAELYTKANQQGISEKTLRNAKKALDIKAVKDGRRWFWAIPAALDTTKKKISTANNQLVAIDNEIKAMRGKDYNEDLLAHRQSLPKKAHRYSHDR